MAVEELLLYLVGIPAIGYAAGALWVRRTMRKIAEHQLGFLRDPGTSSRFFVFLALFATPIVFGLVVFVQASQPFLETPVSDQVLRTLGWTYAIAAALTILSEAWIIVRWKAASFREMFSRVLILAVVPEIVVVWFLNVATLGVAVITRDSTGPPLSQASAGAISRSLEIMMLGAFAAPLVAFLASRAPVLNTETFRRIILRAVVGSVPAVVCLAIALTQLPRA
ncbi:MAG: hypothetical protein E6K10_04580 [Methanobacteriota archaeon]|nr:MAG: hypothetical protein E6K10_04580 [Euryarchaeota archaeon]